jgi:micrococcal nuclease
MIRVALVAAAAALAVASLPHSRAHERATVVDGDTIRVRGERVRVLGLDAAEMEARCPREAVLARQATERMRELIAGGVEIEPHGRDRYGRLLAVVTDAEGRDVARVMVYEGLAGPYWGGRREGWCG